MKYERLTVIEGTERIKNKRTHVDVICDCGIQKTVSLKDLKKGNTKSCGCYAREKCDKANKIRLTTHGQSYSKTYKTWRGILNRCKSTDVVKRKYYLDKGISVCERWLKFEFFLEDMGERVDGLTIDRIDNSKGYNKENCRWATTAEQAQNRTSNNLVEYRGVVKNVSDWARELKKDRSTIYRYIKNGHLYFE